MLHLVNRREFISLSSIPTPKLDTLHFTSNVKAQHTSNSNKNKIPASFVKFGVVHSTKHQILIPFFLPCPLFQCFSVRPFYAAIEKDLCLHLMEIVQCTTEEFDTVVRLFRQSLEEELRDPINDGVDIGKVVDQFENVLRQKVHVVPSYGEDQRAQSMKNEIEDLQRKALRLNATLKSNRTLFIENVRSQVEKILEEQRPKLDLVPIPEPPQKLSDEVLKKLGILDNSIERLTSQLASIRTDMDAEIKEMRAFAETAEAFYH